MHERSNAPIRTSLEKLQLRKGQVNGFNVYGFQLRAPDGIVSWKIGMWNQVSHSDYWVTGNEFRLVGTHIFDPRANGATTYEIGPIVDVPEVEHKAIEDALEYWRENDESIDDSIEI